MSVPEASTDAVAVDVEEMRALVAHVLRGIGASSLAAYEVSQHLVNADLSGHASHGVMRLPQYVSEAENGIINPSTDATVEQTASNSFVVDGGFGFGHAAAAMATHAVGDAALRSGVAIVTIRNCTHIGRLGEYAERLADRGLISLIQVGAVGPGVGSMAAFGSKSGHPSLNTNPWAIGAPGVGGHVIFDGSMTSIAEGKVHAAKARGAQLPPGAILDASGQPSTEPEDFYAGGTLTPLGGAVAGHKGYGLALAAALLGGLAQADGSEPALRGLAKLRHPDGNPTSMGGVTIIAIDPGSFGGDHYPGAVSRVGKALRSDGALVPGDLETRSRSAAGELLSVPAATWGRVQTLASRFPHS